MDTLFGTETDIVKIDKKIKINAGKNLTKNQKLFNTLATRIENLE